MSEGGSPAQDLLRERVTRYVRAHHTMTIATVGPLAKPLQPAGAPLGGAPPAGNPHAASVFYAVDDSLRLIFLSKPSSLHGTHIGGAAPVAVTISEDYADWEKIQGVQLWGQATLLHGASKARAMTLYIDRFPFVREMIHRPGPAQLIRGIGVYRVEPSQVAFTDNTTGVFGREVLALG